MKSEPHILIVDDDKDIRDLLDGFLKRRGLRVSVASDAEEMQSVLARAKIDLIILDVMLPGKTGIEICRELRGRSRIPIIMLTAIADPTDRVVGLEMGADDYVAKPFDPGELLARVRAVLRRFEQARMPAQPTRTLYRFEGWTLDSARRRLTSPESVRVELTSAEFSVLEALAGSAQRVLSRDELMELAGNASAYGYDRSVDILISRLRRKLGDDARRAELIVTVRGGGYQFVPEVVVE
ncbi:MAG: response regulator [Pararhizobium sp.]